MWVPRLDVFALTSDSKDNPKIDFSNREEDKQNEKYASCIFDITSMTWNNILLVDEIVSQEANNNLQDIDDEAGPFLLFWGLCNFCVELADEVNKEAGADDS